MCGRFAQYAPLDIASADAAMLRILDSGLDLAGALNQREPRYNVAPTQTAAVLARNAEGRLEVKGLRWGFVPPWARDSGIATAGINARVETVSEKPMFRAAFKRRRCVVPINGYFEWKATDDGKQPYFIHGPDHAALLCAGIWEAWRPKEDAEADWLRSFALLTGSAGLVSGNIHDRQPVVLPADRLAAWLDGTPQDDALRVLADLPEAALAFHPVSRRVNRAANDDATLMMPLDHNARG